MSRQHVDQKEIAKFAADKVNLPKDKANEYRAQARGLREKLVKYLAEHPDFSLRKMLISGSLAKHTALRTINDIDIACYISGSDAPRDLDALLDFLAERIRMAYPNFSSDQISKQTYAVTVNFRGTGLNVDFVPILYYDDPDWYGDLVSQDDGSFLKTCIPRHLEFSLKRRQANDKHFAQVVRLVKFWARRQKAERTGFRFKSFMIELILSHLADEGCDFEDYAEALQSFFTFVAKSGLSDPIIFEDYYKKSVVSDCSDSVQLFDPVNPENNVGQLYTDDQREMIVDAALDAGDAIDSALSATTSEKTVYYWKKIFGPTFSV